MYWTMKILRWIIPVYTSFNVYLLFDMIFVYFLLRLMWWFMLNSVEIVSRIEIHLLLLIVDAIFFLLWDEFSSILKWWWGFLIMLSVMLNVDISIEIDNQLTMIFWTTIMTMTMCNTLYMRSSGKVSIQTESSQRQSLNEVVRHLLCVTQNVPLQ